MNIAKRTIYIVGVIVGIIAIIVGFCVMNPETYTLGARNSYGGLIEFGGDFQTEIYRMTYQAAHQAQMTYVNICNAIGWLIVIIGAIDICVFLSKSFDVVKEETREHSSDNDELPDL